MQQLDISLDSIGYIYSRQLHDHTKLALQTPSSSSFESVCHYYDILVHDPNNDSSGSKLYSQFNKVIQSLSVTHHHITPPISRKREFVQNNERRQYLIDEFITTEANYLASLKTFVSLIVEPLRQRSKDRQRAILGQYECANIFMNIDELVKVTEDFYADLIQYNPEKQSLGDLCLSHMRRFTCYNRFLLGVHNAQIINEKQMKHPAYFHFVEKAINSHSNGNQTVYDYLALPSQRVGRYTMYFKELMKHTTDDHADLPGLHGSLLKAEEIANMTEEIHTQLMKIFRRLLQTILYCPESLISFQRRFIGYLDTIEVDAHTLKPIQPVTLFLFSDKIMVAKRPSYDVDGLDLCGLDQRMYEGSERIDFCIRRETVSTKMKFIGWTCIDDIDLYDGPGGNHITLLCNNTGSLLSSPDTDQTSQRSLEAYFQHDHQKHCFLLDQAGGNVINREHFQTMERTKMHFIYQFGKAKNEFKQSDELIQSAHCQWNHHHFFANIYPTSKYHQVTNKNEIALFYIERNTINIEAILSNCFVAPNMVGFIVPHEKEDNYRFAMRSKCAIGNTSGDEISLLTFRSNDLQQITHAQTILFGNLLACDRDLSKSAFMACNAAPLSPTPVSRPTSPSSHHNSNSRFSLVKHDLIRKKSRSTFKLFTSLANSHQHTKSQPNLQQQEKVKTHHARSGSSATASTVSPSPSPRPRTTSTYSEFILGLEASGSSIYHSTSSASSTHSVKSQHSHESRLTLQSLASSNNTANNNSNNNNNSAGGNVNRGSLTQLQSALHRLAIETPTLSNSNQTRHFSPSFHPTRTASYEIQSAATRRSAEEAQSSLSLSGKLEHILNNRSRSPMSIREPTPAMLESGSGFSTLQSQGSSTTISTINNTPSNHFHIEPTNYIHHRKYLDNSSPRPLSDLVIPIAAPSKDFDTYTTASPSEPLFKRSSSYDLDLYAELEDKNRTVLMLTSLLQKKDDEINLLKEDLEDSVAELGTVCDKFNSELDHLATMYNHEQIERPSHPPPDVQMRKKLETTLRERNHWQLRATELEHQLRMVLMHQQQFLLNKSGYLSDQYLQRQQHRRSFSQGGE